MMNLRAVALLALVLLAGCGSNVSDTPTSTVTTTVESTPSVTTAERTTTITTENPTTTETTATTTTADSKPENPWGEQNVTVAIWNRANPDRSIGPLVNETLAYWNEHASEYGDYDVTFVSRPNRRDADIAVEYVTNIDECGYDSTDDTVGCAPVLDKYDTADRLERVRVVAGYSNNSTVQILKHEFGHVLGIDHGEEPMPTMQEIGQFRYLSQPDIADRPVPWFNSTLSVYADFETLPGHDRDDAREQVNHALDYYESGADGAVPRNVSFVWTSNESAADVRIRFPDDPFDCGGEHMREGSCGSSWAYNTDTDDAYEYYSEYLIRLRGLDMDVVGWHVGYWLADAMGLVEDELPDPFVDAGHDDRRSDWWE